MSQAAAFTPLPPARFRISHRVASRPPGTSIGKATAWSPTGEWVAAWGNGRLQLLSSDGKNERPLDKGLPPGFGFSRDGAVLYAIRRGSQTWDLVTFDVHNAHQKSAVTLPVPAWSTLAGFSLHPYGKSFVTSVGTGRYDIWLLEGFQP